MSLRRKTYSGSVLALFAILLVAVSLNAQEVNTPKVDVFAGYSWWNPGGTIPEVGKLPAVPKGWDAAVTFNFNKWFGLTADAGGHYSREMNTSTYMFGPQIKYRTEHFSPFGELLFGWAHHASTVLDASGNSGAIAAGGGIDIGINRWFSWRMIQGDYVYNSFTDKSLYNELGLNPTRLNSARVQSGALFSFGGEKPLPVSASCSAADPAEVMAGEPVKVTLTPTNFNPKRTLTYAWTTTGGKASGDATTTIDTTGLAPGSYTVTGKVNDNGKGKHMMVASCTSNFTVKEPPKHPPVISCSANPTTVKSGDPATITATASSPDNRSLTYSWNASGGRITGTGATVQLDTAGAPAGPITVNGTVSDDRGLTASCTATVGVEVPPPPPTASKLNEIAFPDKKRPARVDNAAKAILDDVALKLQRDADAKAVIIGSATADELKVKKNANLAAERAYNTKQYLTAEKGIDPARLELRTGGEGQKAEIWIVPAGASFNEPNTTVVDESKLAKPAAKKPAAKKKAAPAQ